MLKQLEKEKAWKIGLFQALGVAIYCGLVAGFMYNIMQVLPRPGIAGMFLMLSLFVFSAAVTGTLVFAYPVYLAIVKNKIKPAINVLGFTLLFSLILIVSAILYVIGISA